MRTKLLAAATLSGGLIIGTIATAVPAFAGPPPCGHASAVALKLDPILEISHTDAKACSTGPHSSATANVVELPSGGPLIDGTTGGTQTGAGHSEGNLLDTGDTPLGRLQLLPWEATVTSTGSHQHSSDAAAVLRLVLIDPDTLFLNVLQSESNADWNSTTNESSGSASSDGAVLGVGGALTVDLLHSDTSSSGTGSSYVIGINGNNLITDQDTAGACALALDPIIDLTCVNASGGTGSNGITTTAANVLTADVLGTVGGGVSNVGTDSGKGTAPAVQGQTVTAPKPAAPIVKAAQLPRTGVAAGLLSALGMLLVAFGAAAVAFSRVRRAQVVA